MENTTIDSSHHVEAQIREIISNNAWWAGTFEKIDKTVRHAEKLICLTNYIDSGFSQKLWDSVPAESVKIMNDCYCRWETEIENQFAHKILTGSDVKVEDYILYERFQRLILKELILLKKKDFETIIFIGSGPFPITAILLHELTGKNIDCLELEPKSAEISRRVLNKLGLGKAIKVHVGNGGSFDLGSYDVVLAALLAKPKIRIMQNVMQTGKSSCRVLCRTSEGLRRLLYEQTLDTAYESFILHSMQSAGYDDTISTVLLSKKKPEDLDFEWLEELDNVRMRKLVQLQNSIIAEDNNNGFTSLCHEDDYYFIQLKNDIKAGLKRLLIIKDNDRYYGQAVINLFHQHTYAHRGEFSGLMLHRSARSMNMSLKIAGNLINESERLKLSLITIDVRGGSSQEKLWQYLGFKPYGILPQYSKVGDTTYVGVLMLQEVEQMKTLLTRRLEALYA